MLLSQLKSSKKRDYLYNKKSIYSPPEICSTKCVIISVAIFWFAFISYLQYKFRHNESIADDVIPLNSVHMNTNNERFIHHLRESHSSQSDTATPTQHTLFWGDRDFDTAAYLQQLSSELDAEIFAKCESIMSSLHPQQKDVWSQAFQEWYLWHNFFYGKTNGIYLDIGAHKPLHLSNTAFFDQCLQWNGICVEPTDTALLFAEARSCNVAKHCVWSETAKLVMIFRSDGDASLIIDEKEQSRIKREVPDRVKDLFECNAIDAVDLLNQYTVRNRHGDEMDIGVQSVDENVRRNEKGKIEIDFISLDVEGAEVEFLKCFPFDRYDVKVWSIEINKNEGLIDELMIHNGFSKLQYLSYFQSRLDAIYVQTQTVIQLPWKDREHREQWSKYPRCKSNK